jgi:hypothetical protein
MYVPQFFLPPLCFLFLCSNSHAAFSIELCCVYECVSMGVWLLHEARIRNLNCEEGNVSRLFQGHSLVCIGYIPMASTCRINVSKKSWKIGCFKIGILSELCLLSLTAPWSLVPHEWDFSRYYKLWSFWDKLKIILIMQPDMTCQRYAHSRTFG